MHYRNITCIFSSFRCQSGVGFLHIKASTTFWYPSLEEVKAHNGPQSSLKLLGFNGIIILKKHSKNKETDLDKNNGGSIDLGQSDKVIILLVTKEAEYLPQRFRMKSRFKIPQCLHHLLLFGTKWTSWRMIQEDTTVKNKPWGSESDRPTFKPTEGMFSGQIRPSWSKSHHLYVRMQI